MKQRGNNIPSDAAFEKLREWKESGTVLKATLFPNKAPLIVSVFSVLETEFMVGIVAETPPHDHHPLDLRGAEFSIGNDSSLDIGLTSGERWLFVEAQPSGTF